MNEHQKPKIKEKEDYTETIHYETTTVTKTVTKITSVDTDYNHNITDNKFDIFEVRRKFVNRDRSTNTEIIGFTALVEESTAKDGTKTHIRHFVIKKNDETTLPLPNPLDLPDKIYNFKYQRKSCYLYIVVEKKFSTTEDFIRWSKNKIREHDTSKETTAIEYWTVTEKYKKMKID